MSDDTDHITTEADSANLSQIQAAHDALPQNVLDSMGTTMGQQPGGFSPQRELAAGWTSSQLEEQRRWQLTGHVTQTPDELSPLPGSNSQLKSTTNTALTTGLDHATRTWQGSSTLPAEPDLTGDPDAAAEFGDTFDAPDTAGPAQSMAGDSSAGGSDSWSTSMGGFFLPDPNASVETSDVFGAPLRDPFIPHQAGDAAWSSSFRPRANP